MWVPGTELECVCGRDVLCLCICVSVGGDVLWGSLCVYQCRSRGSPEAGVTAGLGVTGCGCWELR